MNIGSRRFGQKPKFSLNAAQGAREVLCLVAFVVVRDQAAGRIWVHSSGVVCSIFHN